MFTIRTLLSTMMLCASLLLNAAGDTPVAKEKSAYPAITRKAAPSHYTFHINNSVNKNTTVDSVLVILDKFDHSGAGIVRKIFYPNAANQIVVEDLPAGKYYADIYVLGVYKKHFSTIICSEKSIKRNKISLRLDYSDVYTPGNANIPAENINAFTYTKL